jgi:hypothetical protein
MGESGDDPEIRFTEVGQAPVDELADAIAEPPRTSLRTQLRQPGFAIAAAVAILVVGILIGYATGRHGNRTVTRLVTPGPSPSSASQFGLDQVTGTGELCSVQSGNRLQLGVEITNPTGVPATLDRIEVKLPMGGMRLLRTTPGSCGQLGPPGQPIAGYRLAPRATTWITVTVAVLVACPAPLPVQINVDYTQAGRAQSALLGGFPDMGNVPYTGCATR